MSTSMVTPITTFIAVAVIMAIVLSPPAEAAPAFFVFGDSLVDSGNNNYLFTLARADRFPYGIDHRTQKPTGRFSNGLNIPDLISEKLGSEPTLPYLSRKLFGKELLNGANFASAGAGILNDAGIQFVDFLRIFQQFQLFQEYQTIITNILGQEAAQQLVKDALVLITLGGNDFINNYFLLPFTLISLQFSIPDFCRFLISEYHKILTRLYELGARRVVVTGVGPLGCTPGMLALRSENGECIPKIQEASELYNTLLIQMIEELNQHLGSNIFIFSNAFLGNMDTDPVQFGFVSSNMACCGQGPYNGVGVCTILSDLCPNRSQYVYWDSFHPTETMNRLIVDQLMKDLGM